MDVLRLLLVEHSLPAAVDDGSRSLQHARALLVFLNTGTMALPSVHSSIRAAVAARKTILVVYEKDGRHGATFNLDGGFDFAAVAALCPEVQTTSHVLIFSLTVASIQDIRWLFSSVEAIPFERRRTFRAAMVTAICEQVSSIPYVSRNFIFAWPFSGLGWRAFSYTNPARSCNA